MSVDPTIVPQITLLDKTELNRTVIAVAGDSSTGNLVRHRKTGSYSAAGVRKNRYGTITLRAKDGLFITKEPILTRDVDFAKYLIEVQFFQPTKSGDTGHPNPVGRAGELFRFEISEPVQDVDQKGQLLTVTLTAIEARLRQSMDSETHRLTTHKDSFTRRLDHYGVTRGVGSPSITYTPSEIELPDDKIKLDWIPGSPIPTHDLLVQNIDSLKQPAAVGGDFDDYYYYFVNSSTITNNVAVKAEIFGTRDATDRGEQAIILTPTRSLPTHIFEKKHTVITDNTNFRNGIILRGANGSHSWPMDFTRFASDWEHAKISDVWSAGATYDPGDYVQFGTDLYKCLTTTSIGESPATTPAKWRDLSTTNLHSPLTNDTDLWIANLDGKQEPFTPGSSGGINGDGWHRGFVVDMNICMTHYDVASPQNPYLAISGKDVEFMLINDPSSLTAAEIVDGYRGIVGSSPTGDFAGQAQRLAEYNLYKTGGAGWEFSDAPVTDDFVMWRADKGQIIRYSGGAWGTASPEWKIFTDHDNSSPFHPVRNITLVNGPEGRPNCAIQWEFDWNDLPSAGGDTRNRASRFAGFSLKFPIPHRAYGSLAVGDIWNSATLDFENLSVNPDGVISNWNDGQGTEDLGELRGVACKLNLDFRDASNNEIDGLSNLSTVWWFRDKFNRTVYTRAKVRRVGQFVTIKFDAGPNAAMQLHENRVEELFQLAIADFTYVFPFNDHLTEKEYTGIKFDWHFVKEMGMFYEGSFDGNFFYKNAQNSIFDHFIESLQQAWAEITAGITGKVGHHDIDTVYVKLAEFRFIKDAYVSSADAEIPDARYSRAANGALSDYYTMKDVAQGMLRRAEHYPQFTPIDSYVDVRMRLGERFTATGPRWTDEKDPPSNTREMVCAQYTIHEGENGASMETLGYTRFGQF